MGDHLYFTPPVINDYVFELELKSYTPIPMYHLDGGENSITSGDVIGFEFGSEEGSKFVVDE